MGVKRPRGTCPTLEGMGNTCLLALAAALCGAGCAQLLPQSEAEVRSPWSSFEQARDAVESVVADKTTTAELRRMGIDPYASPNVQLLTFSDIALKFPVSTHIARLDDGLHRCLEAGKGCVGYSINVRDVKRDRVGNFWLDAFGFERAVEVSGWTFNALVLVVDDRVVYTLYGGQPRVAEREVMRQPLGPAQTFGQSLPYESLLK